MSPNYQRLIKEKSFSRSRFEERLENYKNSFLEEIDNLIEIELCNCDYSKNYSRYTLFAQVVNSLMHDVKRNKSVINQFFDEMINIYIEYIENGTYEAINRFNSFLQSEKLLSSISNPIDYNQLLYRARETKKKNLSEFELFHVPFSALEKISNQRFSISGQPVLYLSKSVITAEKEIEKKFNQLQFSAFLPNYSYYYKLKVYQLSFNIFDALVKNLPALCKAGATSLGNVSRITHVNVKRDIFTNILCFPLCNEKSTFIAEYVLPQMFTSILKYNNFCGIEYPTAKMENALLGEHLFSSYNQNVAFFVQYQKTNDYDSKLKASFIQFVKSPKEKFEFSVEEIKKELESIRSPDDEHNYNNYIIPIVKTKLHIEYLEKAQLNGKDYFKTKEGKVELFFIKKLIDEMKLKMLF